MLFECALGQPSSPADLSLAELDRQVEVKLCACDARAAPHFRPLVVQRRHKSVSSIEFHFYAHLLDYDSPR